MSPARLLRNPGDVLLSQGDAPQVPSALAGLTAVFGMGTGVAPPPWSPENLLRADREPSVWTDSQIHPRAALRPSRERSIASTSMKVSKPSAD